MTLKINNFFKPFLKSRDGNVVILAAMTMGLVALLVAVGVDSTRLVQASTKLKALNDMAALAATTGQNKTLAERKAVYESIMETGITNSSEITGYTYVFDFEDDGFTKVLNVTAHSEANLFFPMTRGQGKQVGAHSEVTLGGEFVEISLVLDISTSMEGARIIELKKSTKEFIKLMLEDKGLEDRVSMAIVPFGGTVKLPNDLQNMLIPPATTGDWVNNTWNGCLVISPVDYAAGITPQHRLEYMPDFKGWKNPWCPESGNELIGLSTNKTQLTNRIDSLTLSDGTATDIGVAWGLATLDPMWRNQMQGVDIKTPRDFNVRTKKIMIVMADGGITNQRLPIAQDKTGSPPYRTSNETNTISDAENGYRRVCELSKTKGVEVFTIGFQISSQNRLASLQNCGTSAMHNYQAEQGQLSAAFENIANSITSLRLSQ